MTMRPARASVLALLVGSTLTGCAASHHVGELASPTLATPLATETVSALCSAVADTSARLVGEAGTLDVTGTWCDWHVPSGDARVAVTFSSNPTPTSYFNTVLDVSNVTKRGTFQGHKIAWVGGGQELDVLDPRFVITITAWIGSSTNGASPGPLMLAVASTVMSTAA
jgi:hypothetical protein